MAFKSGRLDPALTPVLSTGTDPGKRNPSYLFNQFLLSGLPQWFGGKEFTCQCKRHRFNPRVRKIPWRGDTLPTPVFLGSPGGSDGKESAHNVRSGSDSWAGKIPRRRAW